MYYYLMYKVLGMFFILTLVCLMFSHIIFTNVYCNDWLYIVERPIQDYCTPIVATPLPKNGRLIQVFTQSLY